METTKVVSDIKITQKSSIDQATLKLTITVTLTTTTHQIVKMNYQLNYYGGA